MTTIQIVGATLPAVSAVLLMSMEMVLYHRRTGSAFMMPIVGMTRMVRIESYLNIELAFIEPADLKPFFTFSVFSGLIRQR